MTPYTKKLHQALIEIGKTVEQREHDKTPSIDELMTLFDAFVYEVDAGDMKAQAKTSSELIAALVKWMVERM